MSQSVHTEKFRVQSLKIPSLRPGWNIDAWKCLPLRTDTNSPCPVIVMAHGLSAIKSMGLSSYAEEFAGLGYACVAFDYRRWGSSDGVPRHMLYVSEQLEDYRTVIKYCRQQPEFDPQRVIVWGTSFSGGHAITLASEVRHGQVPPHILSSLLTVSDQARLNLAASIAQCPWTGSGVPLTMSLGLAKTLGLAVLDVLKQALGLAPVYIPAAAFPGQVGVLTGAGAVEGMHELVPEGSDYPNEMSASSIFELPFYKPIMTVSSISCPLLLLATEEDNLCPLKGVLKVAKASQGKSEVLRLPGDHFVVYPGQSQYRASLEAQKRFLGKCVPA